jgi:hypothetical protein
MSIFILVKTKSIPEPGGCKTISCPDLEIGFFTDFEEAKKASQNQFGTTVWEIKPHSGLRGQTHWIQRPFWKRVVPARNN